MKESNGARESYDFKTDHLCVVGGNEQLSNAVMKMEEDERGQNSNSVQREDEEYWNDILIQFDEEMKFLEEEIETFLFLEEMPGIENFLFQEEELEDEVCLMEYEYTYNEGGGATTLKESDKDLMNNLEESSIASRYTTGIYSNSKAIHNPLIHHTQGYRPHKESNISSGKPPMPVIGTSEIKILSYYIGLLSLWSKHPID